MNEPTCLVDSLGNKRWKLSDGKYHRIDGPAIEWIDGASEWWVYGKRHRLEGPAVIYSAIAEFWYLNGVRVYVYDQQQFNEFVIKQVIDE